MRSLLLLGSFFLPLVAGANEVAVASFLEGGLRFDRIAGVIAGTLDAFAPRRADSLEVVFEADRQAREIAGGLVRGLVR
ncbi:MAG: hypothetical protein HUU41_16180 [Bryobacteraceae bacterium]|nr:hypothetical protein [Bryobacteraceae bacterium]